MKNPYARRSWKEWMIEFVIVLILSLIIMQVTIQGSLYVWRKIAMPYITKEVVRIIDAYDQGGYDPIDCPDICDGPCGMGETVTFKSAAKEKRE